MTADSQPYRVQVEGPNGPRVYELRSKNVGLRGGKSQSIFFFVPLGQTTVSPALEVAETLHAQLPLEGQIRVARALVDMLDIPPEKAAALTGGLKADVEGMSIQQRTECVRQIQEALQQEDQT